MEDCMSGLSRKPVAVALAIASGTLMAGYAVAQSDTPPPVTQGQQSQHTPPAPNDINQVTNSVSALLAVPLVNNIPGGVSTGVQIKNPMANDAESAQRGKKYFVAFNCVGCHMANGGGGMGPALSNSFFKYGSDPGSIYLVISHGAPLGMPAWSTILPQNVIWDLVSYVEGISKSPETWGTTVSAAEHMPAIEQVPAEFVDTDKPWDHVEPFSSGQRPR
jgi:cytochrome c oxidase cbb3-type subunit 3